MFYKYILLRLYLFYWGEGGIRLWHDMTKHSAVFWDSTGGGIKSRVNKNKDFALIVVACLAAPNYYAPVAVMVSEDHTQIVIEQFFYAMRDKERLVHDSKTVPVQMVVGP